jgi:prenyltransferase/squalene oxidase-like repeat protein
MRKGRLFLGLLVILVAAAFQPAVSGEADSTDVVRGPEVKELSAAGQAAIEKGLAWLARQQQPDGSFIANVGYKLNDSYRLTAKLVGHPGVSALAGMAFLAGGNLPGRGKYGANVEAVVSYLLTCVTSDGMISENGTRMYSHAFATLFLAEIYGMTRDVEVKTALEKATAFTWKCQNSNGAWRYAPYATDSDMSITVCQVMALRAARNIGIRVPRESVDRAVNYVLMSANTSPHGDQQGSFKYQYRRQDVIPTRSSYSLTAAGLATLYSAGLYSDQDILAHIRKHNLTRFLRADPPPRIRPILDYLKLEYKETTRNHYFFYYGNYYAVQAMFIAGGEAWESYFRDVQSDLVSDQEPDGHWPIQAVGDTFSTAVACLILQIPYRYLPIFQR